MGLFGNTKEVSLNVEGMTCAHCTKNVQKALEGVDGVKSAKVDLEGKKATVKMDADKTDESKLVAAIQEAGYQASV